MNPPRLCGRVAKNILAAKWSVPDYSSFTIYWAAWKFLQRCHPEND